MVFELVYAILLFALTYVLMLVFSKYRPQIAIGSAVIFIVTGMLPLNQIVEAIDFNVLMMIAGTMGLVKLFIDSKMPALLADLIMEKVPNVQMAAVALVSAPLFLVFVFLRKYIMTGVSRSGIKG